MGETFDIVDIPEEMKDEVNEYRANLIEAVGLKKHLFKSTLFIPHPSSITCIRVFPASLIISFTDLAPLSIEFSKSSLTTEEGL
jgi:hypothetical protein